MKTKLFIALIVLIVICLWMMRYSITSGVEGAYKLDRFTGKVTYIDKIFEFNIRKIIKK
jgi:hypothetical protein